MTREAVSAAKPAVRAQVKTGKVHDIYYSPITGKKFPVPRHAKEIAEGTLKSIKKDAGLE